MKSLMYGRKTNLKWCYEVRWRNKHFTPFWRFLYKAEALGCEQAAVVTMTTTMLQPLKGNFCPSSLSG